jgi:WD repeat-containing protein 61
MAARQVFKKDDAHTDAVWSLCWLTDSTLVSGSVDGTLKSWWLEKDTLTGPKFTIEGEFTMGLISVYRLADDLFAATSMDGCIRICDVYGTIKRKIEAGPVDCWSLSASNDGSEIVSGTYTGAVNIWNTNTGELTKTVETAASFVLSVARHGDLIAAGNKDGGIFQVNLATGEVQPSKSKVHHLPVRGLCYSKDGTRLYSASDDGQAACITSDGMERIGLFKGHLSWVLGVACNETYLATASADRRVRVWDLETKECVSTFDAHAGQAFSVAFNPKGDYLASGGSGGEIQLFSVSRPSI